MEKGTFKKQLPTEILPQNKVHSVPLHIWIRAEGKDTNEEGSALTTAWNKWISGFWHAL